MDLDDLLVEGEAFLMAHPLADREQLRKYLMRFEPGGVRDEDIRNGVGVAGFFGGLMAAVMVVPMMLLYGDGQRKAYAATVDKAVRILWKRRKKRERR